jgi:PAS domain S-box-containing protein
MFYFFKFKFFLGFTLVFLIANNFASGQEQSVLKKYLPQLESKDDSLKVRALAALCWEYRDSDPKKAMEYGFEALKLAQNKPIDSLYAEINNYLGVINRNMGNYDKALTYFFSAIKVYSDTTFEFPYAAAINNIGNIYYRLGLYNDALKFTLSSYSIFNQMNSQEGIAYNYNQLGEIYQELDSIDKALAYHEMALKIREKIKHKNGVATSYMHLAEIYLLQKKIDKAFQYANISQKKYEAIGSINGSASCDFLLGDIYLEQTNISKAEQSYQKALIKAKKINASDIQLRALKKLATIAGLKNESELSLNYFQKYSKLNDSLKNVRLGFQLAQLSKELEMNQNLKLAKSDAKHQIELREIKLKDQEQRINIINSYIGVLIIMIIAIILYTIILRRTVKKLELQKSLISDKNHELYQQAEEIKSQTEMLLKANEDLEKLSIVARETDNVVLITNEELEIIWANDSFSRFYGFTLDEFKMTLGAKLYEVSGNERILDYVETVKETRESIVYSNQYKHKNGNILWTQTVLTPVFHPITDKLDKLIAIDSDITELKKAKDYIDFQNKEITSSISYASRLQKALMPLPIYADALLENHFILYYPKDIVSGDFYWFDKKDNKTIIAVADCTGHGIPGAFMTALSITLLRNTIAACHKNHPEDVLFNLRNSVIKTLHQRNESGSLKDGFDISLAYIDFERMELEFSGANLPLLLIRNGIAHYYKPDKMPIAIYDKDNEAFRRQTIKLEKGDMLYMFTDGFMDQFGGPNEKKYYRKRLIRYLETISDKDAIQQKRLLSKEFIVWKGDHQQIDDVLLVGFRV